MNPKPENDTEPFSVSKILLNFEMEKLAIGISKTQYQNVMLLADSMGRMSRGMPYRKYRPFVKTYKGHYREWWKFAYTCVLEENVRRRRKNWDWLHICSHRELCKEYATAYQVKFQHNKVIKYSKTVISSRNCYYYFNNRNRIDKIWSCFIYKFYKFAKVLLFRACKLMYRLSNVTFTRGDLRNLSLGYSPRNKLRMRSHGIRTYRKVKPAKINAKKTQNYSD